MTETDKRNYYNDIVSEFLMNLTKTSQINFLDGFVASDKCEFIIVIHKLNKNNPDIPDFHSQDKSLSDNNSYKLTLKIKNPFKN